VFKIGAALAAATVGVILAIATVFAHSAAPTTGHSVVGGVVAHAGLSAPAEIAKDPFSNLLITEQETDAQEAAELAAKIAAEQAALAAKLAALKAAAAADPCLAADANEDATEKANEKTEDAAEKANPALETANEDATEKANEKAEDSTEVKCAGSGATKAKTFATFASGTHHSEGKHH
jgi:hypothetical protein